MVTHTPITCFYHYVVPQVRKCLKQLSFSVDAFLLFCAPWCHVQLFRFVWQDKSEVISMQRNVFRHPGAFEESPLYLCQLASGARRFGSSAPNFISVRLLQASGFAGVCAACVRSTTFRPASYSRVEVLLRTSNEVCDGARILAYGMRKNCFRVSRTVVTLAILY